MIESRLLQYFLAVAKEQSITKAAEFLHISQPTLSKQIMDLEAALNKQLLIRGKKRVILTEEGEYLRRRAQEIMDLMDITESAFRQSDTTIGGDIYIGSGEYRSIYPLLKMIGQVQAEYPNIHVHFLSGNADIIVERLDRGLADFGILLGPAINEKYDYFKLPMRELWGILMRKDSPLTQKETISVNDLSDVPLIMPSQNFSGGTVFSYFAQTVDTNPPAATYNLIYNAGLMVEAGIGYALCIDNLANTSDNSPLIFRPLEPTLSSDIYLVYKKYQVFSKATKLLLDRFKGYVSE